MRDAPLGAGSRKFFINKILDPHMEEEKPTLIHTWKETCPPRTVKKLCPARLEKGEKLDPNFLHPLEA